MNLFNKENLKKVVDTCTTANENEDLDIAELATDAIKENVGKITSVKVLSSGCKSCKQLFDNATKAVKALGMDVEVEYVDDIAKVAGYGVMSTPALVINEKVVSVGKVIKSADMEQIFHKFGF